jgi:peptide/nickel transport system permease protein
VRLKEEKQIMGFKSTLDSANTLAQTQKNGSGQSWGGLMASRFLRQLLRSRTTLFGTVIVVLMLLVAALAPYIAPYEPNAIHSKEMLLSPSSLHLLGTDDLGRDILSRIIFGARVSIMVGAISIGIAMLLGIPLGLFAGFYGGLTDSIFMRIMDVLLAFPAMVLALFIMAILGPSFINAMIAVGIVYTPNFARLVRANVLSIREMAYVEAARSIGSTNARIMFREILPNTVAPLIVQTSLGVAYAILVEAALSFLGMGVQPPTPSWGSMLSEGRLFLATAPWCATFPGLAIFFIVMGLNTLGDGLREVFDPRMR